jgi:hypothetical protein
LSWQIIPAELEGVAYQSSTAGKLLAFPLEILLSDHLDN